MGVAGDGEPTVPDVRAAWGSHLPSARWTARMAASTSPLMPAIDAWTPHLLQPTLLLGGSLDVITQEMVMLDAVFVAESLDHANWSTLGKLADKLPPGEPPTSFERLVHDL